MSQPAPIRIVFDTDCILCSAWVHFLLRHERERRMVFLSAHSVEGAALAAAHGMDAAALNRSYLVVAGGRGHVRSDAGLVLITQLRWPLRALGVLRLLPPPLRDLVYDLVARNRYRWFGRKTACFLPPPDQRHRFVLASDQVAGQQDGTGGPE